MSTAVSRSMSPMASAVRDSPDTSVAPSPSCVMLPFFASRITGFVVPASIRPTLMPDEAEVMAIELAWSPELVFEESISVALIEPSASIRMCPLFVDTLVRVIESASSISISPVAVVCNWSTVDTCVSRSIPPCATTVRVSAVISLVPNPSCVMPPPAAVRVTLSPVARNCPTWMLPPVLVMLMEPASAGSDSGAVESTSVAVIEPIASIVTEPPLVVIDCNSTPSLSSMSTLPIAEVSMVIVSTWVSSVTGPPAVMLSALA